ncbi:uncharacterized protein TRAVEDRAFT_71303 [Trametes versicolor FP-101664 SS1]|uniref:uncharacterized protein n=1 Tax=Trametes versicolor (strain FP-101664) TaxID=717944 RepID=UPI0004621CE9|nr:uncharacterized protein TRAVEDRAFT_71303 [Trametes versicolor FP-101664 SS1]EIW59119.1 hypothetical protein TRAVEDRAFT_71303 [Trametes versicolor FP-101664 SS1]
MSTTSLPNYVPSFSRIPSYSAEPQEYEQRLALNRPAPRPVGDFVKQSKGGNVSLRLFAQEDNVSLPVYGSAAAVEGAINLTKTDGVTAVEVKIEGSLKLQEVAEGGTTTHKLCLSKVTLWSKETDSEPCPASLKFSLTLPETFSDGKDTYPLPPTHNVHLSGVPGFDANIEYGVSATVVKGKVSSLLQRLTNSSISTPFIYHPRSRPALPLPEPMYQSHDMSGLAESPDWRCWESTMKARTSGGKDIHCQLYLPSLRVFSISQPIPFHIMFSSSAFSLAAYLPYGPTATILAPNKQFTRIKVVRQSIVDVRNALVLGTKTDIWRVDTIGEAECRHSGDGSDWLSFVGEIRLDDSVKVGGFKAGGLTVKDFIELSMIPPDPVKCPFREMRLVIPIRLTTDPWSSDGYMLAVADSDFSAPPTPPDSRSQ